MRSVVSIVVCGLVIVPIGVFALTASATPVVVEPPTVEALDPAAKAALDAALAEPETPRATWDAVIDATLRAHGDVGLLVKALEATTEAATSDAQRVFAARRALVFALHRDGKIARALEQADKALALQRTHEIAWVRARLLDALDRVDDAIAAYRALEVDSDDAGRETLGLRIALLEATRAVAASSGAGASGGSSRLVAVSGVAASAATTVAIPASAVSIPAVAIAPLTAATPAGGPVAATRETGPSITPVPVADEGPPSVLSTFASRPEASAEFRNRAAIVLALLQRPREASRLFAPVGAGAERFRQEVRLAEWALAAGAHADAQEHAWIARGEATLRRDRLYALTLLVEAHRADGSQAQLIERFAATPDLDAESRRAWIDVLRETARVDEALAMFRTASAASSGAFTADMRRELLEMCREAGREDELVATYREMIASEPERVDWREGLARYWLERGRRADADAVWDSYLAAYTDAPHRLAVANSARDLGQDELAQRVAEECIASGVGSLEARMFLFDFHVSRGQAEAAIGELVAFDREALADSPLRIQLAEAFERVGDKQRAADVLTRLREQRGQDAAEEDLDMRLAWLLSEVGDETTALERWRSLWHKTTSLPRRRQIEDRLMAVASRLGVLADLAIELEEKLADGRADDREAGLLVRLYQKVGDPASAAEIIGEHMKKAGADPIATLNEKSRVYLGGRDYYNFEKTVRKLIELDPEHRADHLRQLAMSQLERGRPREAQEALARLAAEEQLGDAAEFEAGVLTLAGLHEDAVRTYRRGLVAHPERIDAYLLLSNALKQIGQTERAIGMCQYLAETADKDDLFTIAIDGLLNMQAKPPVLRWARRIALERLANAGHDRMYLYQLVADLAEELEDNSSRMRAMENSLAIAGEQRASVLRELMDVAQGRSTNSFTIVNGMVVEERAGGDDPRRLAYGRRLIGLGDLVPPQVYLELGEAFLRAGEIANASKTFSMARDVPDWAAFQRQIAESFEGEGYVRHALTIYERTMASQGVDVGLMAKTGELYEQLGRDDRALEQYHRGIGLLLARHPLVKAATAKDKDASKDKDDPYGWAARNVGEFETQFPGLVQGFVAAATDADARRLIDEQRAAIAQDLRDVDALPLAPDAKLENHPRLERRSAFVRDLALRFGVIETLEADDLELLRRFPADDAPLLECVESRARYGLIDGARALIERSARDDAQRTKALVAIGLGTSTDGVGIADVAARFLPLVIDGERDRTSALLRGVRLADATADDTPRIELLLNAALFLDDDAAVVTLGRFAMRRIVENGKGYQDSQQIEALLTRMRAALDAPSYALVVDALVEAVVAKKDSFSTFAHLLTQLQAELGRPLFEADALKTKIDECLPDQSYLVPGLLMLVAPDARMEVLQGVWTRVPPTERADLALSLIQASQEPLSPAMADFVVAAFEEGLTKVDDPSFLTYQVSNLQQRGARELATTERIAAAAYAKFPSNMTFAAVLTCVRHALGRTDDAVKLLDETIALVPQLTEDYELQEVARMLAKAFAPPHDVALTSRVDAAEAAGVDPTKLMRLRLEIADERGDSDARTAILAKALAATPDSVELLRESMWDAANRGDTRLHRELLERLHTQQRDNAQWRDQLMASYRSARDPLRALAVKNASAVTAAVAKVDDSHEKQPPASVELVKKAVDAGDMSAATTAYRRLWRRFQVGSGRNRYGIVFFSSFGGGPTWPEEPSVDASKPRSRGGLDALLAERDDSAAEAAAESGIDPDSPEAQNARKPKPVHEVVATLPFGRDVLTRELRAAGPEALATARGLVRGVQRATVAAEPDAPQRWLERTRTGVASQLDRALLLSWYEDRVDAAPLDASAPLAELGSAVLPYDSGQLRSLARLWAKLGDTPRASRIWQWCATLATSNSWVRSGSNQVSARDLLEEVRKYLSGDERDAVVRAILERSDPGGDSWERESYVMLILDSWSQILGPRDAVARCRDAMVAANDLSNGILRNPAAAAVPLWLASDAQDDALRALEIALCSFTADQVKFAPNDAYSAEWKLRAAYIDLGRARKWFPAKTDDATRAWVARAGAKLLEWDAADRLQRGTKSRLFALVAVRAFDCGEADLARRLVDRVDALARGSERLLVADLRRKLGDEASALAIEDELFAAQALYVERVPELIDRVRATEDAAAAYRKAEEALAWTAHPGLIDRLIDLAKELGRTDDVTRFEAMKDAQTAAAKALGGEW
ncbi:MAG: hypothetical protein IPH13_11485 [Planctomycetes bacterium]|nr:hypothetical protein [Planctomycetota bacterium]